ncbi:DUF6173 family protein [Peptostreptococcus faecalis]|uniref:DUF6173 family protein n=1 Tax=Peptostreptococcus faecalis TaxID=2045015 RepID=UPI000C7B46AA
MSSSFNYSSLSRNHYLADYMYERLAKQIDEFEKNLPSNKQSGIIVNGYNGTILVDDIGYHNPDLIFIYGSGSNGEDIQILQHVSQVNLFLVAVERPSPEKPRRKIGFSSSSQD